ncbi:hypothetical protein AUJ64_02495 [Candidatus Pacearchaeota archaeon CG1_02_39_14]|nr:MAG: hypothetical protein AUJ64_02495 [Candidatus Pacearchaeota archaeon CG1_02_39_14]
MIRRCIMHDVSVEIYWDELSRATQEQFADALGFNVDEMRKEMNWDIFPITTVCFDKDEINPEK